MAFLTIEGMTASVAKNTWQETPRTFGDTERNEFGSMHDVVVATKRDFSGQLTARTPAEALAWRKLLHGDTNGETWFYDGTASEYGSKHRAINSGGSYTAYAASGKYDSRVVVDSGSTCELPTDIVPDDGYSIAMWVYTVLAQDGVATGWHRLVLFGSGTTVGSLSACWDGAAAVTASSLNLDDIIQVASDGDVTLEGKEIDGGDGNQAKAYSQVWPMPFALPEAMARQMYSVEVATYGAPYVMIEGDCVEDTKVQTIGRMGSARSRMQTIDGTFYNNAKVAQLQFMEA